MGPRDGQEGRKISSPPGFDPGPSSPSSVAIPTELPWPTTEMSTRNISWGGKGGWCVGLTSPPSCAECLEIWEPQPPGTLGAYPGL